MHNPTNWGTIQDAADLWKVSVKTIRRRIADNSIDAMRVGPRLIRVDLNSLDSAGHPLANDAL